MDGGNAGVKPIVLRMAAAGVFCAALGISTEVASSPFARHDKP